MRLLIAILLLVPWIVQAAAPVAKFPSISLNAQTNVLSANATNLTFTGGYTTLSNSVKVFTVGYPSGDLSIIKSVPYSWPTENAVGALQNDGAGNLTWSPEVWETVGSTNRPTVLTNLLRWGQFDVSTASDVWMDLSQVQTSVGTVEDPSLENSDTANIFYNKVTGTGGFGFSWVFMTSTDGGSYTGGDHNGAYFLSTLPGSGTNNNGLSPLYFGGGIYPITAQADAPHYSLGNGSGGFFGNSGKYATNFGLIAECEIRTGTNSVGVGIAGTSYNRTGVTPIQVGVYAETASGSPGFPLFQSAVALFDNRATGLPLIIGRTNNGTVVFKVSDKGNVTAGIVSSTKAFQAYQGSLTHAGTVTLDFDAVNTVASMTLTGNVTFATSNLATNRTYRLKITGTSTNATPTFPAWNFLGGAPSTITASKVGMLSLEAWGTADTDVVAAYAESQ